MACTRMKIVGYLDIFLVISLLGMVIGTTLVSLHFLDTYDEYWTSFKVRKSSWIFSPSLTWVGTGLVVMVTFGQFLSALHMLRAGNPVNEMIIRAAEVGVITNDWLSWNRGSCIAGLIWCVCFGVPLFLDNKWPLSSLFVFFLVHGCVRAFLGFLVKKMATQVYPAVAQHTVERAEILEMQHLDAENP